MTPTLHRYAVKLRYWAMLAWSYLSGSRARRGREWDALRAETIRRNRSNGAKAGWAKRKARERDECLSCEGRGDLSMHGVDGQCGMCNGTGRVTDDTLDAVDVA